MTASSYPTRKNSAPIYVYCLPSEKAQIESMARTSGHSASSYLRLVGQGYVLRSIVDFECVQELVRVNGDLGRMGGLLKLWLSNDAKLAEYDSSAMRKIIFATLEEIRTNQGYIRELMSSVVTPLSPRILAAKILPIQDERLGNPF